VVALGVGLTTGAILGFGDAGGPLSKRHCENESPGTNCTTNALVTTVLFGGSGTAISTF
jgi:hypothetical protein